MSAGFDGRMDMPVLAIRQESPDKLLLNQGFAARKRDTAAGSIPEGTIRFNLFPERFDINLIAAQFDRIVQTGPDT